MFDLKDLKVGDKVKVISEHNGHYVGEQGTITAIEPLIHNLGYIVRVSFGQNHLYSFRTDYPKDVIEKVKEESKRLKVGDKVRCIRCSDSSILGKVGVIIKQDNSSIPNAVKFEGVKEIWWHPNESLMLIEDLSRREKIITYSVGNEVFAKLIYSDKSFTVASAKCNPSDNFDILVGAQIALQRLAKKLGSKLVLPTEALDAIDIEVKIKDKENFEVV